MRNVIVVSAVFSFLIIACNPSSKKTNQNSNNPNLQEYTSNSYCYIKDGNTKLYAESSINSIVLWYFTVGDVVQILDHKTGEDNWVKVKFTGNVKAGYEGLRSIGGMPNDSIGWIEINKVDILNCK
ncbi:MAG: hypothetical protein ACEPOV_13200 [Hyphomicrobiales bacterium]